MNPHITGVNKEFSRNARYALSFPVLPETSRGSPVLRSLRGRNPIRIDPHERHSDRRQPEYADEQHDQHRRFEGSGNEPQGIEPDDECKHHSTPTDQSREYRRAEDRKRKECAPDTPREDGSDQIQRETHPFAGNGRDENPGAGGVAGRNVARSY